MGKRKKRGGKGSTHRQGLSSGAKPRSLTLGRVGRPNSKEKLSVDPRVLGVKLRSMRSLDGGGDGGMSVARPAIRPAGRWEWSIINQHQHWGSSVKPITSA